ncbi:Rib/alpha-like domain-containing protein [Corynebacterium sp. HMSC034A01]|uniref:Rib/alpha-like domain-containing protein n=1 Tax=Corynebacterium sp. HMSC034A01 TaxID=1739295 RepID=UPI0008AA2498|nr:Rib/alpha-like domain-containing protein [Corynebacterium sp. HMSC034A01]OHR20807.1 hypothetical protein HMPREF2791_09760 [Corynebacterium sp. HMSC034A01]
MSLPGNGRVRTKRITAVATVLALAGGAAEIPLGPAGSVAHAQIAPTQQPGISFGSVNNLNGDWEASVFFESAMTVRTVSIDFVPPDSDNPKEEAPADDPVFTRIPEVAEYRVDHMKRSQVIASYDVTARRTQSTSTSGHPSIRITYELPGVQVGQGERLALFAPGKGTQYPTPLRGGGARFTRPTVNGDIRGSVTMHDATEAEYKQTMVEVRQGAETFTSPVQPDGSYEIALPSPSGTMTINVVPPAGFVTPEPKTWEANEGLAAPDFDVYPITVSGTLLDTNRTPVQGATVRVAGLTATTDQDGNFTVTKVPAGTRAVVIGDTERTRGKTVPGVSVSDQRDNRIEDITVETKPQFGTVSGRVTDPDGSGVAGVTVKADTVTGVTDANGYYSIAQVPVGGTTVSVVADTVPTGFSVDGPFDRNVSTSGVSVVDFSTTRETGTVSGRVLGPDSKGVAGVTVTAGGLSARTDAEGKYSIAGVPTGTTTIEVTASPTQYLRPAPQQKNVTVNGVEVDFPLALKPTPTPKPSPTPKPTPKPTTSAPTPTPTTSALPSTSAPAPKPSPTTPKLTTAKPTPTQEPSPTPTPTPKPLPTFTTATPAPTTQPPAPTVGSVAGKVTDPTGKPVPGATVTARDANGKESTAQVAKDGTFRLNDLPPGDYTVTVGVPTGHVAPPPANVTVKAGEQVQLPGFVVNPDKPKAQFNWDRVVVKPGQTQVTAPTRTGDTTTPPNFRTSAVTQIKPDGTTTQLPAEESWISVEGDGTVVARPPRNTAPGEYRVEVQDDSGETHTITVEVDEPTPMAQQHEVRFPLIPVPAGATRQAGRPRATVTDGPFVYADRRLPEGTRFEVDPAYADWVRVDNNGRLTFTPPKDAAPGIREIPVKVTFPDGSSRTYIAEVEIGDPLLADTIELGYEEGLSVRPGEGITVLRTGAAVLPEGTTFEVDRSQPLGDWVVIVDEHTGNLRVFAPQHGEVKVPVIAYFADGSSAKLTASVRVSTSSALSAAHSPSYADVSAAPGGTATVKLRGSVPAGTTFAVVDGGGLRNVGVDKQTGALKIELPADAQLDTPYTVTVRVRYADGSTEEITAQVTAASEAARFIPRAAGVTAEIGEAATVRTGLNHNAKLAEFDHDGWQVFYDRATGELTAKPNSDVPVGTVLKVPMKVTFPDGSTKIVEYAFTATDSPTPAAKQNGTSSGSSVSAGWIAVVLGLLAMIAGVGWAAFLNQDAIRAQLKHYGF